MIIDVWKQRDVAAAFLNLEHVSSPTARVEEMFNEAMTEHLFMRRRERGEDVTWEQVCRDFMERPDRAANILASVEEQCQWLRGIGFVDVDCFWKYFELAAFGGFRRDMIATELHSVAED